MLCWTLLLSKKERSRQVVEISSSVGFMRGSPKKRCYRVVMRRSFKDSILTTSPLRLYRNAHAMHCQFVVLSVERAAAIRNTFTVLLLFEYFTEFGQCTQIHKSLPGHLKVYTEVRNWFDRTVFLWINGVLWIKLSIFFRIDSNFFLW